VARRPRTPANRSGVPVASRTVREAPATVHTSLYLPGQVHDALRKIAYDERIKIHDLVIEGIDAVLKRRGYQSVESRKAGKMR
jgi:hypothetical protein